MLLTETDNLGDRQPEPGGEEDMTEGPKPSLLPIAMGLYGVAASILGGVFFVGSWQSRTEQTDLDQSRRISELEQAVRVFIPQVAGLSADMHYMAEAERERQRDNRGQR